MKIRVIHSTEGTDVTTPERAATEVGIDKARVYYLLKQKKLTNYGTRGRKLVSISELRNVDEDVKRYKTPEQKEEETKPLPVGAYIVWLRCGKVRESDGKTITFLRTPDGKTRGPISTAELTREIRQGHFRVETPAGLLKYIEADFEREGRKDIADAIYAVWRLIEP